MANDYTTTALIKASLPSGAQTAAPSFGTGQDTHIGTLATRASRMIDRYCGRPDGYFYVSADVTNYYTGDGSMYLWIDDLAAAPTSLAMADGGVVDSGAGTGGTYTAWSASDYRLWPYNAANE